MTGIIESWNNQQSFQTGPVTEDKLSPVTYGRIRTLYGHTWREEKLSPNFDWGAQQFSVYLPESLYVVSSVYLKIDLPANASGNYKDYPALYAMKTLRLMSNGNEVYTVEPELFFHEYLESLSEESLRVFSDAYLGKEANASGGARSIMVPILLPNSQYLGRTGDNKGHGIFPFFLGTGRLELQITMNPATHVAADVNNPPASIAGACTLMYHQVEMSEVKTKVYADLRGKYSIINRRFTELTSGWTEYANANTVATCSQYQPQGCVTELMIVAVAENADESRHGRTYILPTSIKITADSIVQRHLDTAQKVKAELWQNGFVPPVDFPSPGRLCFAAHASRSDHVYSGAYNMANHSNVVIEFTFATTVRYKVIAAQIQRVTIDAEGAIRSSLQ